MGKRRELVQASPTCTRCLEMPTLRDVLGFSWCQQHEHYLRLINWLEMHNWPFLKCEPYTISPGKWNAVQQIISSEDEDRIWFALAFAEYLEAECAALNQPDLDRAMMPLWEQSTEHWQKRVKVDYSDFAE